MILSKRNYVLVLLQQVHLDAKHSAKVVNKAVQETKVNFEGINYVEVALYLAMTLKDWEIMAANLHNLLLKRKKQKVKNQK